MSYTKQLTYYVAQFVDELSKSGLTDVVISPGSRSTPLALTFAEHEYVNHWVHIDERSAAFFALGMAKEKQKPVAILCTSGTAAANYYPAIVEAYYSRIPLLVLTADRPHELRDVGAPQAINQIQMFGNYVKWFQEMAIPDDREQMLKYARSQAARSFHTAYSDNAGPVHLNFPFREPLVPDFSLPNVWGNETAASYHPHYKGEKRLTSADVDEILDNIQKKQNGLIVCGPQTDKDLGLYIAKLAEHWNVPVLVDPLSQLRTGKHSKNNMIESYDAIMKSETVRDKLRPDYIIRFGAMPVSKAFSFFIKENEGVPQYIIEPSEGYRDPTRINTHFLFAESKQVCEQFLCANINIQGGREWLQLWQRLNTTVKGELSIPSTELNEGHVVSELQRTLPNQHTLFVGNSMPIRDVDTFFTNTDKDITIHCNRGANGIDGVVSTALGVAATGKSVTLLIGDVSFYHDLNGLLAAKQYNIDITVVLINNEGGGIFSFLPQAKEPKHFEVLFGTPLHIPFEKGIEMYGGRYERVETWEHFTDTLTKSYNEKGMKVIEVLTNRKENARWHKQKWSDIEQQLLTEIR
ncbi:2-succinyl-5-enolpyruvyl-6-hydroxy-3-cyclohexene-1-carboxylic-acid synthase [Salirhabdus salicampi]|uniref:2-succinyl-5-enolpyruvyl-6-hydroxy-3- cyclohexene-1-carboxylic-acid synthase n=1 Tax=Salirhabdus salicampi TaxID=476102 RepID=UPI0020C49C69|nr:2-succinyl-5-enolpyruvyl-6-hydroxy-3-cyclohexene-1-carboxylic-acid synthase [Salirhabdus salicampi]MCP8617787.1 2-succinyl-5-enolpyruvyl-6-hydroxy-3-cyclohexene-1-carboxylic-acid synthase [Salirhabdus salicampi]